MGLFTAWRRVKEVMAAANVSGTPAMPKDLRHAFGVKRSNLLCRRIWYNAGLVTHPYALRRFMPTSRGPEERGKDVG